MSQCLKYSFDHPTPQTMPPQSGDSLNTRVCGYHFTFKPEPWHDNLVEEATGWSLDFRAFILPWQGQADPVIISWETEQHQKWTRITYSWDLLPETCFLHWVPLANVFIMSQSSSTSYHKTKYSKHEPGGGSFHIRVITTMNSTHVWGCMLTAAILTRQGRMHRRNHALLKTMLLLVSTKSWVWH